jgi:beta-lactam-binding protein with PASTA domain
VPDVIGQNAKQALAALGDAGLKTKVVTVRPDQIAGLPKVDNGAVAQTDPAAGEQVQRGSTVTVVVVQDNAD